MSIVLITGSCGLVGSESVKFFSSKVFSETKIIHGFFTRNGGKSKKPFDSLNCSFSSKDDKAKVIENINSRCLHQNVVSYT